MELQFIPIESEELPMSKRIDIEGQEFQMEFDYNSIGDFITLLCKNSENKVLFTSKLVYGVEANHFYAEGFPIGVKLIPADIQDVTSDEFRNIKLNKSNLGKIKIYIIKEEIV